MVAINLSGILGGLLGPVNTLLTGPTGPTQCPKLVPANSISFNVAPGYEAALVANGLTKPRSLQFDSLGNLLIVESGKGITAHSISPGAGTCVWFASSTTVVSNTALNHGMTLSKDGLTLYASTTESAYSWSYDPALTTVGQTNTTLVANMATDDHTTRTLLISPSQPNMLLVSRGSTSNIDPEAASLSSGHSQIRAFDLSKLSGTPYDYDTDGLRLGWGLRNSVGVGEHPVTGGIYSVENSADQLDREGTDIHEDNPGEEMNYHGAISSLSSTNQGPSYGYPYCFAAWSPSTMPDNSKLVVGSQFCPGVQNSTINDAYCAEQTAPRLTFQAHMAPLDIKFNDSGSEAFVSFHGSWDRTNPSGYKVSRIEFDSSSGQPIEPSTSTTAAEDVFTNQDNSKCPNNCFRPAGLAVDSQGRLWVASDASGEVYVIVKTSSGVSPRATPSPSSTVTALGGSATGSSAGSRVSAGMGMGIWYVVLGILGVFLLW